MLDEQPTYIYKILTKEEWLKAKITGTIIGSTMDIKDGFIHLSTSKQIKRIANKYFPDMTNGYLIKIDYKKIKTNIKWEPNSKGELFAHSYKHISNELIIKIYKLSVNSFNFKQL